GVVAVLHAFQVDLHVELRAAQRSAQQLEADAHVAGRRGIAERGDDDALLGGGGGAAHDGQRCGDRLAERRLNGRRARGLFLVGRLRLRVRAYDEVVRRAVDVDEGLE